MGGFAFCGGKYPVEDAFALSRECTPRSLERWRVESPPRSTASAGSGEIAEWPGGTLQSTELKISQKTLKSVIQGARYVPVAPIGRRGPAYVRKGWWSLEVDSQFEGKTAKGQAVRRSRELLRVGYGPRSSAPRTA